jgi:hypothetical protein
MALSVTQGMTKPVQGRPQNQQQLRTPHWMIMWPFDPKTSGLPKANRSNGTWIMWSGTPYAHLMINGKQ